MTPPRQRSTAFKLALIVCVLLFAPAAARAQEQGTDAAIAAARQLGEQGIEDLRAGDLEDADQTLERAYELFRVPTLGLWSARARARRGRLVEAAERYAETLGLSPEVGDSALQKKAQLDALTELHELRPRIPRLTIQLQAEGAAQVALSLDGKPVPASAIGASRPIDPGAHRLVATSHGGETVAADVHLAEGENKTLPIEVRVLDGHGLSPQSTGSHAGADSPGELDLPSAAEPSALLSRELAAVCLALLGAGVVWWRLRSRRLTTRPAPLATETSRASASKAVLTKAARPKISAAHFDGLVPDEFAEATPAIATLLGTFFRSAIPVSRGVVQLCELRLDDASSYDYFALLMPQVDTSDQLLRTRYFVECATPLESELAKLPRGRRKVVLAISGVMELGRGVRKKMLEYRGAHDALVVPLYIGEIQAAHRANTLRALFEDRISALHPNEDLYAEQQRVDPSRVFGMYGEVQAIVAGLQRPEAVVVVDGLPGSGKTSLVARASFDLDESPAHVHCESIHPRSLAELARQINSALKIGSPGPEPAVDMNDSFRALAAELRARDSRPIVVLDDADWLMRPLQEPQDDSTLHREFWRGLHLHGVQNGLRVVVIAVRGFALCQRTLEEWHNPLAKIVTRCSVPPLDRATASRLIREPGIQMNVHFTPAAVRLIYRETAGNLQLVRSLCSELVRRGRPGFNNHGLQRLTVGALHAWRAMRIQAGGASVAGERALPWLFSVERAVLHVIASHRPTGIDDIRAALPDADRSAVRRAVDRLVELRIVDTAYRVTIPFVRRWLVAYFGAQHEVAARHSVRRFGWVGAGLVSTLILATGYHALLGNRQVQSQSATSARCVYSVMHPARVTPRLGFSVYVSVSDPCRSQLQGGSVFLRPGLATLIRTEGKEFTPDIPVTLRGGGAAIRISVDQVEPPAHLVQSRAGLGAPSDFNIELRNAQGVLVPIQLGTDWIGTLGDWGNTLARMLVAVPTLIGVLATFFEDLRAQSARILGLLPRRRVSL